MLIALEMESTTPWDIEFTFLKKTISIEKNDACRSSFILSDDSVLVEFIAGWEFRQEVSFNSNEADPESSTKYNHLN